MWLSVVLIFVTVSQAAKTGLALRRVGHSSYHTFPLDRCGQATHRGWPFLELEQFLPAVLSLSLRRPFGTHCWTMSSTRTLLQLFKEQLKTPLFFTAFSPQSASAFLIMALLKFYHCIVLYCIAKLCSVVSELLTYRA